MTIDDDIKTVQAVIDAVDYDDWIDDDDVAAMRRVLAELRRLRSALPRTADMSIEAIAAINDSIKDKYVGDEMDGTVYVHIGGVCIGGFDLGSEPDINKIREGVLNIVRAAALDDGGKG
jgi:hypothetical protein